MSATGIGGPRSRPALLLVSALGLLLALGGCGVGTTVGKLSIVGRGTTYTMAAVGVTDYTAKCLAGEQLVSGGYALVKPTLHAVEENFTAPVVLANFPSAQNVWTVTVENRDANDTGEQVFAFAYCATTPNLPLGMTIQSQTQQVGNTGAAIIAQCPNGMVLTAGGYQTGQAAVSLQDAEVRYSKPATDQAGNATGWTIDQYGPGLANGVLVNTTAYALCAGQNLTAAPPVMASIPDTSDIDVKAACAAGQLALGGGYWGGNAFAGAEFEGMVYSSEALPDFSGWETKAVHLALVNSTYQTWTTCVIPPA